MIWDTLTQRSTPSTTLDSTSIKVGLPVLFQAATKRYPSSSKKERACL